MLRVVEVFTEGQSRISSSVDGDTAEVFLPNLPPKSTAVSHRDTSDLCGAGDLANGGCSNEGSPATRTGWVTRRWLNNWCHNPPR